MMEKRIVVDEFFVVDHAVDFIWLYDSRGDHFMHYQKSVSIRMTPEQAVAVGKALIEAGSNGK